MSSVIEIQPLRIGVEIDVRSASNRADVCLMLPKDSPTVTTVDLEGLTVLGTTGIELLLDLQRRALAQGVTLHFINIQPQPRRKLATQGLSDYFGIDGPLRSSAPRFKAHPRGV